jgi:hypothetical protein
VEYESTGAMILDGDYEVDDVEREEEQEEEEEDEGDQISNKVDIDGVDIAHDSVSRSLDCVDDDSIATSVSASTYGAVVQSVLAVFISVLSANPFALNLNQSVGVLSLCGSLLGVFIITIITTLRLDHSEKLHKIYVKKEQDAAARKLLRVDIKNGGHDDLGAAFHAHMKKLTEESRSNWSMKNAMLSHKMKSVGSTNASRSSSGYTASEKSVIGSDDDEDDEDEDENDDEDREEDENGYHHCTGDGIAVDSIDERGDIGKGRKHISTKKELNTSSASTAIVTEFFHKLFPGRSIFQKEGNILQISLVYHDYFNMLTGTTLRQSRTLRLLNLVCIIFVNIFTESIFFGIYFPSNSPCTSMTNKVRFHC